MIGSVYSGGLHHSGRNLGHKRTHKMHAQSRTEHWKNQRPVSINQAQVGYNHICRYGQNGSVEHKGQLYHLGYEAVAGEFKQGKRIRAEGAAHNLADSTHNRYKQRIKEITRKGNPGGSSIGLSALETAYIMGRTIKAPISSRNRAVNMLPARERLTFFALFISVTYLMQQLLDQLIGNNHKQE